MALAKDIMGGGFSAGQARALGGSVNTALAAAGSTQGDATLIKTSHAIVTGADGTKGVILPAVTAGESVEVVNNSASTLKVYPPTGGAITVPGTGLGSANAAYSQTTYAVCIFTCLSTTQWTVNQSAFVDGVAEFTTVTADSIVGGDSSLGITGQAAAQGGDVPVAGGASSGGNNAGGVASLTGGAGNGSGAGGIGKVVGGQGGATGAGGKAQVTGGAGGATSGAGGAAEVTGGAGTAGNGNGGSVVLTGGAAHGTGAAGVIIERSVKLIKQGAVTAKTTDVTLTAAEVLTGIITANQGAAGAASYTLPLATAMDTALPDAAADDAFDFSVINISTNAAEDATIITNTGWTLVGEMTVESNDADRARSSGRFRARKTGAGAWTLYRIS